MSAPHEPAHATRARITALSGLAVSLSLLTCFAMMEHWPMPFMPLAAGVWFLSLATRRSPRGPQPIAAFFLVSACAVTSILILAARA